MLCGVCVTCAHVARLELFELLLCAQFVGLETVSKWESKGCRVRLTILESNLRDSYLARIESTPWTGENRKFYFLTSLLFYGGSEKDHVRPWL